MLTAERVDELLQPFGFSLSSPQFEVLVTYLDLLLRWNRKINLTAVTNPSGIVQRHFGESFYLSKVLELAGKLFDIGSGAGFPGLALKIAAPELEVTLLEPVAKKRAFLKEVARACQITDVEVLSDRLEAFAQGPRLASFDLATARAVGGLETLVPAAAKCLKHGGQLALWLGADQVAEAQKTGQDLRWSLPVPIPLSNQRIILVGKMV
jgi:16S rRNA (guanine527-N7)-methyltransferase